MFAWRNNRPQLSSMATNSGQLSRGSKMVPRWLKMPPRMLKVSPRRLNMAPVDHRVSKMAQDGSRRTSIKTTTMTMTKRSTHPMAHAPRAGQSVEDGEAMQKLKRLLPQNWSASVGTPLESLISCTKRSLSHAASPEHQRFRSQTHLLRIV